MKNQWRILLSAVAVIGLTVVFQNCSAMSPETSGSASSLSANPDDGVADNTTDNTVDEEQDVAPDIVEDQTDVDMGTPVDSTPEPVTFAQGELYNVRKIPYRFTDNATIDRLVGYMGRAGYKAMAFTEDGDLFIASSTSSLISSQAEWDQITLERCQLENLRKFCSLFASGNVIAQSNVDFFNGFMNRITVPAQFDPNFVPGHLFYWRERNNYNNFTAGEFKSYAVGSGGAATAGWSRDSQADATRRALEICEGLANSPCTLYAVARDVVFDINTYQWENQRVFYGPTPFDVDRIPFVTSTTRETLRTAWNRTQLLNRHMAIALDRYGRFYHEEQAQPFSAAQLENLRQICSARIMDGSNRKCFIYSVDDTVVFTRQTWVDANAGL